MDPDYPRPYNLRAPQATEAAANDLSQLFNNWFRVQGPTAIFKTCATCVFMRRTGSALCERAGQVPPIDIIMRGCDDYKDIRLAGARIVGFQRRSDGPNRVIVEELTKNIRPVGQSVVADLDDDIPF